LKINKGKVCKRLISFSYHPEWRLRIWRTFQALAGAKKCKEKNVLICPFGLTQKNEKVKTPFLLLENYTIFLSCVLRAAALAEDSTAHRCENSLFCYEIQKMSGYFNLEFRI
jgi:hypothetical protein